MSREKENILRLPNRLGYVPLILTKKSLNKNFFNLPGQPKSVPSLKKYVFGVVTIPKFQTPQEPEPPSDRTQRTKRRNVHVHINLRSVIVLDMFVYTVFVK